ncbi:MAG: aminoacyl-tRNA hydrolase [Pseudomonadota bacterium]
MPSSNPPSHPIQLQRIKALIGLGNPGPSYHLTRHNLGFRVIDAIASDWQAPAMAKRQHVLACKMPGDDTLWLVKPSLFMNQSGRALVGFCKANGLKSEDLLVIHDELGLAPGQVRMKQGGGHNGHRGLRDIDQHLGRNYWRLRLGIGHPGVRDLVEGYVLAKPPADEQAEFDRMVAVLVEKARLLIWPDEAKSAFANALPMKVSS